MHHGIGHIVGYTPGKGQVGYTPNFRPGDPPLLVTSGGDNWTHVQICSFGDIWWWPLKLKHIRFPSGRSHPTGMLSCYKQFNSSSTNVSTSKTGRA